MYKGKEIDLDAFDELNGFLDDIGRKAEENYVLDVLEVGAKTFVEMLLKLPKPRSQINAPGYTHLIDSFAYKRNKNQIEVGWGKYYGPMQERGTSRMSAIPHMVPTWNQNKEKILENMLKSLGMGKEV